MSLLPQQRALPPVNEPVPHARGTGERANATDKMKKKVLMIAFHFPPMTGSSGIQRTLRFVQHLPKQGWEPLVLTVAPQAYESISADLSAEVPHGTVVARARAFDAARHLAVGGRYLAATARPDRWMSWKYFGVAEGMRMIKAHRPDAIWSTYPIATAHVIAREVQRRSGLPWIADFRDPMAQSDFPPDPRTRSQLALLETRVMQQARMVTLTTPSACRDYREKYSGLPAQVELLENGYDEGSFSGLKPTGKALNPGCVTLLHSGIVYPTERDPTQLFVAIGRLLSSGQLKQGELKIRFRACVHERLLLDLAKAHGAADAVEFAPQVAYGAALSEMLDADALLVLQAGNCNQQIPAKIYEYLRADRPILCLSDPAGDTWRILSGAGISSLARLDSAEHIATVLSEFLAAVRHGTASRARSDAVSAASREGRSAQLAALLNKL